MRLPAGCAPLARGINSAPLLRLLLGKRKDGLLYKMCVHTHKKRAAHMCSTHVALSPARAEEVYTMNQYFGALVSISWRWHRKRALRSSEQLAPIFCILMPACCSSEVNTAVLVSAAAARAVINIPIFSFLRTAGFHRN